MKLSKILIYSTVVFLSLLFLVVSILNANNDALTFDEVAHIPAGYSYLTQRDMRLNPEHPPLIKDLAAFPLLFLNLKFNTQKDFWQKDINGQWEAGHNLLWQENNNPDQIAFWARLPIILIALLLGLIIFKWTKELAGLGAGLLAFLLYVFDPNILGHNHFVTTDIGIATFITLAFYFFTKFIVQPTWKNAFWGGIFLGLAHTAKFSSITIIPIMGLILVAYPLFKSQLKEKEQTWKEIVINRLKHLGNYLLKGSFAFLISFIVIWLIYLPNISQASPQVLEKTINHYISPNTVKNTITNHILNNLNQNYITRPFSEYGLGLAMVFQRVAGGNGAYYFGQVSSHAFPTYFPVVFLMKETLGFLILLFLAIGSSIFFLPRIIHQLKLWLLPHYSKNSNNNFDFVLVSLTLLTSYIFLYAYISITGNLNIGLRHLFPIFPPLIIITAYTITTLWNNFYGKTKLFFQTAIILVIILLVTETVSAYPYYLSFFNWAIGGPKEGYHYVTDSNADWGQDLKRLKKFLDKHPQIQKIHVDYFGGGNPQYYLDGKYLPWWDSKRPIEPGYYAISTNFLMGSLYDKQKSDQDSYRWITKNHLQPIAQVGTSILIYKVNKKIY